MTPAELEEHLRLAIRFALQRHGYAPPRSPDTELRDRYFNSVADAVVRQIKCSWAFEAPDALRKKPPSPGHSTSQFMSDRKSGDG